ncbi:hypothetical protein ACM9HD_33220 [Streptomyces sp. JAC25]|uniref:hypothetical protein n=1 Tax=Streptomyces sp. JAC25 TaxID=3418413 RepID=UPI003D817274
MITLSKLTDAPAPDDAYLIHIGHLRTLHSRQGLPRRADTAARRGRGSIHAAGNTMMSETAPAPAQTPGLITQPQARTALNHTAQGRDYPSLLITYPAPQFEDVDQAEVERLMHGVALTPGAVPAVLPEAGPGRASSFSVDRVSIVRATRHVHFCGTPWSLRFTRPPGCTRVISSLGRVPLVVGRDELSPVASAAEVDKYIEAAGAADRLYATVSSVASSAIGRHALRRP